MALAAKFTNLAVNTAIDALAVLLNTGYLRIYDGSQPANADDAIVGQILLAELRYNATAFGAAVAGVATANALTGDPSANNTGTATWFRALKSDGTTIVMDGSVGAGGTFNLVLDSASIVTGTPVDVTSHTLGAPKS